MNKIFRIIWNHAQQNWVVTSELAKGHTKAQSSKSASQTFFNFKFSVFATTLASFLIGSEVFAADPICVAGTGDGSVICGAKNSTTISGGGGSFAVGNANGAISVSNSGVFGNGNTLTDQATSSRVVGNNNYVNGQESFILGNDIKVQKDKAGTSARVIGIGSNVTVNDNDSIAIGTGTYTDGNFVTAMGNKANASGDQAVAIGSNTVARESSTALGQQAQATGNTALAVGAVAKAEDDNSMAVGQYSQALSASSVAIGPEATVSARANNATALGYQAKAEKAGALAMGYGAQATLAGSVALGERSNTAAAAVKTSSATVNGITYSGFAGDKIGTSRVVSVGTTEEGKQRQIKNVAAGQVTATSTDAINGSQLYVVADKLSNAVNNIANATNGGFILTDDSKTEAKQDLGKSIQLKGEKGITVTANAADKQLKIALGNEITVGNPEDPSNPAAPKEAGTINVVGKDGKNGVSIKGDTGNEKPGISIAGKDGADGVTLTTKTDGKPGVDGDAAKPRLEVNNEQVATLNDGVKYAGDIGNAAIKLNQTATIVGGVKDKSNLTDNNIGVVASQDGDDAKLTVKLAKNLNLGPDGSITISNSSNDSSSVRLNKDGLDNGGNKIINVADGDISQNSKDAVNGGQLYNTIQQTVKAVKIEVKEGDNIVITSDVGSDGQTIYTVSTVKDVKFDSAKIGNKVTINNNGIDAGDTKVTGVKAGDVSKDSTDAVNGSQLHETNQNVAKNATNISNNTAAIKKGLNFTADDGKTLNRQLGDTVAVNGDENVIASVTSSGVKVALNKKLKVDSVTAGNTVVNNDGVIIGTGDKAVSLTQNGLNNGGNRITNVAPGKDPTDAVNVAQLSNVTNHLDNKVNKVASDMKHMDKKLRAGIAGAAALGVLAQPTRPGKSMVSVGGTTYRDESAVALGVSRVSDNEKWVIKIGASANTRNNYIAGGSVGYQW
ncbi:YadA-like family protein [Avibacterium avium]|uniref:YadA-like family protein n=1 Tax=Avibacterium avium TaxID=751 RepID=UPI003BF85729